MLAPSNVWSRISSIGELLNFDPRAGFSSDEFSGRYSEAAVAIEMFYDYPLLGIGKEQYPTHYLAYSSRLGIDTRLEERQTHNLYLEIMAEQGLVGLTTFGLAMFMIFRKIQVAKNHLKQKYRLDLYPWLLGVEYGLVTYLLASLFLHGAFIRYFWLMVGVTITGINLALMAKSKADQERDSSLMG